MPDHQRGEGGHLRVPLRLSPAVRLAFAQHHTRRMSEREQPRAATMPRLDDVEWAAGALVQAVDDLRAALDGFDGSPEALDAIRDAGHSKHTAEEILRDTRSLYRAKGTYRDG